MSLSAKFGSHACTHKGNNMGVFEWSLKNILTVVCIVYVCLIPAVTSQSGTVFSVIVQDAQSMNNFSFDSKGFTALYQCLCSANYDACQTTPLTADLKDVRGCQSSNSGSSGNMFTECKISTDVICSRKDLGNVKCNQTIPKNVVICDNVQLEWNFNRKIALQSHTKNIDLQRCSRYKPNCVYLKTNDVNSFEERDELLIVDVNATASVTTPSSNPAATSSPTTSRSSDPTASSSPTPGGASSVKAEDDSDDDIPIIIGVIVGVVVVVAIIVIIVVVLWKRKKKSPSSPGINNNSNNSNNSNNNNNDSQLEDTDISPYATYSMSNVRPNQYSTNHKSKLNTTTTSLNSNNDNTNHNQATPDVYATVDLSKKQKKTAASPDNNNDDSNSETSSRQKKRKSNRNLDYEDLNMDNGAGYYYSSSDVLNDQTSANCPPNSSAKPKSYNVYSETGEEPSAAYAQVLKKDKSKDESAASEEIAGPSRSYDNSGYEFVTIGTPKESSL